MDTLTEDVAFIGGLLLVGPDGATYSHRIAQTIQRARQLEQELAAERFKAREWKDKAQDLIAEREEHSCT